MEPSEKEILCIEYLLQMQNRIQLAQINNSTQNKKEGFLKRLFRSKSRVELLNMDLESTPDRTEGGKFNYIVDDKKTLSNLWSRYGFFTSETNQVKCIGFWVQILYNKTYDIETAFRKEAHLIKIDQDKLREEAEKNGTMMKRKNYGSIAERVLRKIDSELGQYTP
jgi:hypothetical protein